MVGYYCCSTADKRPEQGEVASYVQQNEHSEGPGFRSELNRRELLDRLGQSSNVYRVTDPFGGEDDVSIGFCSSEDQSHPDDDPMGESDFGI